MIAKVDIAAQDVRDPVCRFVPLRFGLGDVAEDGLPLGVIEVGKGRHPSPTVSQESENGLGI